jgi:RNA polymerase sigma-70 factor (ECF subfamily)
MVRRSESPPTHALEEEHAWYIGLRAGQPLAFDTLYTALVPALHRFAQRFVAADVAEDVVQEVMVDLWERRATLVIQGTLRGYLFGAVRRRIAVLRRHAAVVQRHTSTLEMEGNLPPELGVMAPAPDRAAEMDDLARAIAAALATLPARAQTIMTLKWVDGFTYPEIAEALDMSVDAAKKQGRRMERILQKLLARFAPE